MRAFYTIYDPYKNKKGRDFLTYPYIPGEFLHGETAVSMGPFLPVPLASVQVVKEKGLGPVVRDFNGKNLILTASVVEGHMPWSGNVHERYALAPERAGDHLNALVYLTVPQLGSEGRLSRHPMYEFPRKHCGDGVQILGQITWDTSVGGWSMGSCRPPSEGSAQMAVTLLLVLEPERTASFYFDTPSLPSSRRRWIRLFYSGFLLTSVVVKE